MEQGPNALIRDIIRVIELGSRPEPGKLYERQ